MSKELQNFSHSSLTETTSPTLVNHGDKAVFGNQIETMHLTQHITQISSTTLQEKIASAITAINLTATTIDGEEYAPTFRDTRIESTLINFAFGNNGTGKSSIAKAIRDDVGIEWASGKSAADYNVLVYDKEFLQEHFGNYNYLPGIFTMGEKNVNIQKEIDANAAQAKKHRDTATKALELKNAKEERCRNLLPSYYETFWQVGGSVRENFKKALSGKIGSKAAFANAIFQNRANPTQHDAKTLKELYEVAYNSSAEVPDSFDSLDCSHLERLTNFTLLATEIVSKDNSPFSQFIKALQATDWVKRGLEWYTPHSQGACPFCQQELPDNFEEQVSTCFDRQYQEDIDTLKQHYGNYERYTNSLLATLNGNLRKNIYSKFSKEQLELYSSKMNAIESAIKLNLQTLDTKLSEPSKKIGLESLVSLCLEVNNIIEEYNRQVQVNKSILADIRNQKNACEKQVLELLAFETQALLAKYKSDDKVLADEIESLKQQIDKENNAAKALDAENAEKNKQIVNITTAVTKINAILRDSGFQGFELAVHEGSGQSAYKVIRPHTGKVAKDLSEGERNFIGFLYFYHLAQGSLSDDDIGKDKVIVIDDPISSMDISALNIVGALTREITDACRSGGNIKGVKQVFVLTHNVHFHTNIANRLVSRFDIASYFRITKSSNLSVIELCVREKAGVANALENFNPVPSEYVALWDEYKSSKTTKSLQSIACQILEYYFVKITNMHGDSLQTYILEERRSDFIVNQSNGTVDNSRLLMATKLLSCLGSTTHGSDEERYAGIDDIGGYRQTFQMIFEVLESDQHYNLMMNNAQ